MIVAEVIPSVSVDDIVNAALRDDSIRADLLGLGTRAFPGLAEEEQLRRTARYVLLDEQMWHDMGAAWYSGHDPFLKHRNGQPNPKLTAADYILILRGFMRRWAVTMHTGSPELDWYKMQDGMARSVRSVLAIYKPPVTY